MNTAKPNKVASSGWSISRRSRLTKLVLLFSLGFACVTGVIVAKRSLATPKDDLSRLQSLPAHTRSPIFSDFYNNTASTLRNDFAPRHNWTKEEALYLVELVNLGYPASVHDRENRKQEDVELQMIHGDALATVSERFTIDGPMDDEARAILTKLLTDQLAHPLWSGRLLAISCVVQSGLVADPAIRAKVERLTTDANSDVAANAVRQLAHYDRLKAADDKKRK